MFQTMIVLTQEIVIVRFPEILTQAFINLPPPLPPATMFSPMFLSEILKLINIVLGLK